MIWRAELRLKKWFSKCWLSACPRTNAIYSPLIFEVDAGQKYPHAGTCLPRNQWWLEANPLLQIRKMANRLSGGMGVCVQVSV